jgi:hypothetical protein
MPKQYDKDLRELKEKSLELIAKRDLIQAQIDELTIKTIELNNKYIASLRGL